MKALIRNPGETITEDMGILGIDWNTGMPLTGSNWAGGPYTLVQNYVPPPDEGDDATYEVVETTTESDDTVVIDGIEYKRV